MDIGHEVKQGELLAEIFVPELDEEHQRKVAQVELSKSQVEQAQQFVAVAAATFRRRSGSWPRRGRMWESFRQRSFAGTPK